MALLDYFRKGHPMTRLRRYWMNTEGLLNVIDEGSCYDASATKVYLAAEIDPVLVRCRARVEHMLEYWNGNINERAMEDALGHILDEAQALLADLPKEGGG